MDLCEPEISKELRFVDGQKALHGFYFHDHPAFHNQVQPVTAIEAHALVEHWKRPLPLKGQPK